MCIICDTNYKNITSYKKHKLDVHCNKHKKNNILDKDYSKDKTIVTKITTNINKNINEVKNEIKTEINKVEDKVDKALTKATSLIKYLMENFSHVPALQKLNEEEYIEQLRLDYKYSDNSYVKDYNSKIDDKYKLEIILIDDFFRNLFVKNISKTILNLVSHKNPNKQPIYNTDSSRQNFVIKINTNWNEDILGLKFTEMIINPILSSIENLINKYRTEYLENINTRKNDLNANMRHIEWMSRTLDFEIKLHNQEFVKSILKELSAHLRFIKDELDELEELNKFFNKMNSFDELDDEFTIYDSIERIEKRIISI
jgi:hypothetical protein